MEPAIQPVVNQNKKGNKVYFGKPKSSKSDIKYNSIHILTTNAAGLYHKASDLKNKVKYLETSIFTVQETHFSQKGKFKMEKFIICEAIRKSKKKGGSMIGVHEDLNPVLIKEYSESFELIVVEIKAGNKSLE